MCRGRPGETGRRGPPEGWPILPVRYGITLDAARGFCSLGREVKAAGVERLEVLHSEHPQIRDVTISEACGPHGRRGKARTARGTALASPGRIACAPGRSAGRVAAVHAEKQILEGGPFVHASAAGARFDAGDAPSDPRREAT